MQYDHQSPLTCLWNSIGLPISQRRKRRPGEAEPLVHSLVPACSTPGCSVLACPAFLSSCPGSRGSGCHQGPRALQPPPLSPQSPWGLLPLPSTPGLTGYLKENHPQISLVPAMLKQRPGRGGGSGWGAGDQSALGIPQAEAWRWPMMFPGQLCKEMISHLRWDGRGERR